MEEKSLMTDAERLKIKALKDKLNNNDPSKTVAEAEEIRQARIVRVEAAKRRVVSSEEIEARKKIDLLRPQPDFTLPDPGKK